MDKLYINNSLLHMCIQPRTFEYISAHMKGLDPVAVKLALQTLKTSGKITKDGEYWVTMLTTKDNPLELDLEEPDPKLYLKKYMGHFDFLQMPHPLDFEWRNTTRSLKYLVDLIASRNSDNDSVLILGMPTLFAYACKKDIPQRITIIDKNEPIINALEKFTTYSNRVYKANIFKLNPSKIGKYHTVYMDPPWYPEYFFQFIWLAAQSIVIGGQIIISIPPINTRPEISQERIDFITFCQKQGLCVEELYSERLEYAMPFFEFNAFRAAGLATVLPFWRKGDIIFFRKVKNSDVDRPELLEDENTWVEKIVDNVRFRVNLGSPEERETDELQISSIVEGDILPTVSTRDPKRREANIWTSGNRIFKTSHPILFYEYLGSMHRNNNAKKVHTFQRYISELEKLEYVNYLESVYYEMERQGD